MAAAAALFIGYYLGHSQSPLLSSWFGIKKYDEEHIFVGGIHMITC